MAHLFIKCKNAVDWQWLFLKFAEDLGEFLSTGFAKTNNSSKQCICIYKCETRHFHRPENAWFLLVEALPQSPENTDLCSGNAARNAAATRFCNRWNWALGVISQVVIYQCCVIIADGGWGIEQHRQQVLLDVPYLGRVFLHAFQYELNVLAV